MGQTRRSSRKAVKCKESVTNDFRSSIWARKPRAKTKEAINHLGPFGGRVKSLR